MNYTTRVSQSVLQLETMRRAEYLKEYKTALEEMRSGIPREEHQTSKKYQDSLKQKRDKWKNQCNIVAQMVVEPLNIRQ